MIDLTVIWAAIIGFAIIAYVVMDGFDLGIGLLFPLFKVGKDRDTAMNSIAPVWDGNETWLVLGGGGLLAAFPLAYAIILPALYAPLIAMLLGLVLRVSLARSGAPRLVGPRLHRRVRRRDFCARDCIGCLAAGNQRRRPRLFGRLVGMALALLAADRLWPDGRLCAARCLLAQLEDRGRPTAPGRDLRRAAGHCTADPDRRGQPRHADA